MCPDKLLLSQWFDNELDDTATSMLKQHIDGCADCRLQIDKWQEQTVLLNGLGQSTKDASQKILDKIQNKDKKGEIHSFWKKDIPWTYAAALILFFSLGTLTGGFLLSGRSSANAPLVDIHQGEESSHFVMNSGKNQDLFQLNSNDENVLTIDMDASLTYIGESSLVSEVSFKGGEY